MADTATAFQQSFQGVDFVNILKTILFWTYYVNDLMVRLVDAILKSIGLPYTNYHATIILVIIYMICIYFAVMIIKPLVKWSVIGLIVWLIIGFFKP